MDYHCCNSDGKDRHLFRTVQQKWGIFSFSVEDLTFVPRFGTECTTPWYWLYHALVQSVPCRGTHNVAPLHKAPSNSKRHGKKSRPNITSRRLRVLLHLYFMLLDETFNIQQMAAACTFAASEWTPLMICLFLSSLGLRLPVAYWRMSDGLMPISRDTPAALMKS